MQSGACEEKTAQPLAAHKPDRPAVPKDVCTREGYLASRALLILGNGSRQYAAVPACDVNPPPSDCTAVHLSVTESVRLGQRTWMVFLPHESGSAGAVGRAADLSRRCLPDAVPSVSIGVRAIPRPGLATRSAHLTSPGRARSAPACRCGDRCDVRCAGDEESFCAWPSLARRHHRCRDVRENARRHRFGTPASAAGRYGLSSWQAQRDGRRDMQQRCLPNATSARGLQGRFAFPPLSHASSRRPGLAHVASSFDRRDAAEFEMHSRWPMRPCHVEARIW
jgi:hypothetical protein